jgi:hypothetical protein
MPRLNKEDTTRRRILKAGLAMAGGAVAAGPAKAGDDPAANRATEQAPLVKFTPEAVHYQPTPNDWQKCLFCMYFQAPDVCGIVSGPVSRNGWCDHFALLHE